MYVVLLEIGIVHILCVRQPYAERCTTVLLNQGCFCPTRTVVSYFVPVLLDAALGSIWEKLQMKSVPASRGVASSFAGSPLRFHSMSGSASLVSPAVMLPLLQTMVYWSDFSSVAG